MQSSYKVSYLSTSCQGLTAGMTTIVTTVNKRTSKRRRKNIPTLSAIGVSARDPKKEERERGKRERSSRTREISAETPRAHSNFIRQEHCT